MTSNYQEDSSQPQNTNLSKVELKKSAIQIKPISRVIGQKKPQKNKRKNDSTSNSAFKPSIKKQTKTENALAENQDEFFIDFSDLNSQQISTEKEVEFSFTSEQNSNEIKDEFSFISSDLNSQQTYIEKEVEFSFASEQNLNEKSDDLNIEHSDLSLKENSNENKNELLIVASDEEVKKTENCSDAFLNNSVKILPDIQIKKDDNAQCYKEFSYQLLQVKTLFEETHSALVSNQSLLENLSSSLFNKISTKDFSSAKDVSVQISTTKKLISELNSKFFQSIEDALLLTLSSPSHLQKYLAFTQDEIEVLKSTCQNLQNLHSQFEADQQKEQEKYSNEVKKVQPKIDSILNEILQSKDQLKRKRDENQSQMDKIQAPYLNNVSQFKQNQDIHLAKIKELESEIKNHRDEIQQLNEKIKKTEEEMKNSIKETEQELENIVIEEIKLKKTEEALMEEISVIQKPQNEIKSHLDERLKLISNLSEQISQTKTKIEQKSIDSISIQNSINELDYFFQSKTSFTDKPFKQLQLALNEKEEELIQIQIELNETSFLIDQETNMLRECTEKLPSLESTKSFAVQSKKFKLAQATTNQIKELSQVIERCGTSLNEYSEKFEKLKEKEAQISIDLERFRTLFNSSKKNMDKYFSDIFVTSVRAFNRVFEINKFAQSLLQPFLEMMMFGSNIIKYEWEMSTEDEIKELEVQLENAVAAEMFDLAAEIQDKLDVFDANKKKNKRE